MYKILVVEDDTVIAQEIKRHLTRWGYEVEEVSDFADVMGQFGRFQPQLVLMDIGLPFYNGYYWCTEIRKVSNVPILFLSSASDNMNIVMAMNMGGDDFIAKPFALEVLSAKIQAILRRTYALSAPPELLEHQGVLLNLADASLLYQGKSTELTRNEFRMLQLLFEQTGRVVSREAMMKRLWNNDCYVDDNTLTVNMTRLRRKLEEAGLPIQILTKKGMGYLLE